MKTIGERAQEFRLAKQWNTTRMAKEVGTSRQSIENLEATGHRSPRYIADLARVMGLTVDELMTGQSTPKPTDIQPSIGIRLPPTGSDDITAAIETVAQALMHIPEEQRMEVLGKFGMLAHAPDSAHLKQTIAKAFGYAVPDAAFAQARKRAA